VPVASIGSSLAIPVIFIGLLLGAAGLTNIGLALFTAIVLFQLVTLPVEFGASRRAMQMLTAQGILTPDEAPLARKVLTAAALTYVIGTLVAIYQLLLILAQSRN
jgi:Zn-dependent membrane protease YugP